jgi:predicted small integral membrane protein
MATLRIIKAILVATVGGWAFLIAYDNVVDYGSNWAFVRM